jgi:hypothetical protein
VNDLTPDFSFLGRRRPERHHIGQRTELGYPFSQLAHSGLSVLAGFSPCDSPLLQRNNTATNFLGSNLGLVHRNDGAGNSDRYTRYDASNTEMGNILSGALETMKMSG